MVVAAQAPASQSNSDRVAPVAPGFIRVLETWHGSGRHPLPVLADAVVAGAVTGVVTSSLLWGCYGAAVLIVSGLLSGLYRPRMLLEIQGITWYLLRALPAGVLIFLGIAVSTNRRSLEHGLVSVTATLGALTLTRAILWIAISSARRRGHGLRQTLVVGPIQAIPSVEHRIRTYAEAGLAYEGSYTPSAREPHLPLEGQALVSKVLAEHAVDQVLFLVDAIDTAVFRDFVRYAGDRVACGLVLPIPGIAAHQTKAHLADLPVVPIRTSYSVGSNVAKRTFDIVVATLGMIILGPVLALVALAIRLEDHGPSLFRQARVGRHGKSFSIVKFRSMVVNAESMRADYLAGNVNPGGLLFKLEADPRITAVGAIIRRLSIDELPQLWNVIKGEMSLVGPRPLPVDPDEFDIAAQIRHRVAPGISGLWQVHGGNALPYADMIDLDLTYVTTRSMGLDLILLARTLPAVAIRRAKAY